MRFVGSDYDRIVYNSLMSYLPQFYENSKVVNEIMRVDAEELEGVYEQINTTLNQRFIPTSTVALDRWGKEFNMDLSPYIEEKWSIENRTYDLVNKIRLSSIENPHRMFYKTATGFSDPTSDPGTEVSQASYDLAELIGNGSVVSSTSTAGQYAEHIFEFDFSHLGLTLTQMKNQLRKITLSYTGFGKGNNAGVSTNGLTIKYWNASTNAWDSIGNAITAGTPTTYVHTPTVFKERLTNSQKIYILVHSTYPAGSTITSDISTDYIKLDVEYDWVEYIEYERSYAEKRALLMLQLRSQGTVTKQLLKEMCMIYDGGETEIIEDNINHEITIKFMSVYGIPLKVRDLSIALRNILPAHLNFKYTYRYMTWNEIDGEQINWTTIDSRTLLWNEVDNGGLS